MNNLTPLNLVILVAALAALLLLVLLGNYAVRRRPRKLNTVHFQQRWLEAQSLCGDKKTWPLAIVNADKLLDEALKQRRYRGKTMGERLVSAQRDIQNNDMVWFGHKLRNKIVHEDNVRLNKSDVKDALLGIRLALKDLRALE